MCSNIVRAKAGQASGGAEAEKVESGKLRVEKKMRRPIISRGDGRQRQMPGRGKRPSQRKAKKPGSNQPQRNAEERG